ncbi:hypothetical protein NI17_013495 [Thermobifida halotolerans]|uniref:Uncharacterized protein n=1 Tax=Thermobifida halotolerans TaxID=483545 RepID=A0AA97M200_9ACTN|nr:hypothetical protein [Thermobifida halotolerans]UOE17888.1 hypothetical protein NI17_013495 [Thermobifida halotolerans]
MTRHRTRTITVEGFASIRSATVGLGDLNVPVGASGAGRSNSITALAMLGRTVDGEPNLFVGQAGGAGVLMHDSAKGDATVRLRLDFTPDGHEAVPSPTHSGELFFAEETVWFQAEGYDRPHTESLGAGHRETRLDKKSSEPRASIASQLMDQFELGGLIVVERHGGASPFTRPSPDTLARIGGRPMSRHDRAAAPTRCRPRTLRPRPPERFPEGRGRRVVKAPVSGGVRRR